MNEFSHRTRRDDLQRMASERLDVLVIGCGIVGSGVARDAALRGLRVAAVDAGDIGGGTSGRTSRLVHGGLRYLERFRVRLVSQAARERDRWIRLAPGLVEPMEFLIPSGRPAGMPAWKLRLGLALYDALSSRRVVSKRRWIHDAQGAEPLLRGTGPAAYYSDAKVDDARFVLEVARSAREEGAAIASYARVVSLSVEEGRVVGAILRDRWSGASIPVHARVVVNATGPWLDAIRALGGSQGARLRPTKGIHLIISSDRIPLRSALAFRSRDGRAIFAIPWGSYVILGTTDTAHRGDPETAAATPTDVDYLLDAANAALNTDLRREDVHMTYASLRPLLASRETRESDISRRHDIWEEPNGLLCVAGGKLTTHRVMAHEVVRRILHRLGRPERHDVTGERQLRPSPAQGRFPTPHIAPEDEDRLARQYPGEDLGTFLGDTEMTKRIHEECPVLWGELDHAIHHELVMTVSDFLIRRTGLLYAAPDHGESVVDAVGDRIASAIGWPREERDRQVAEYRATIAAALDFRR